MYAIWPFLRDPCTTRYAEWHIRSAHSVPPVGRRSGEGGPAKPRTQSRVGHIGWFATAREWRNVFLFTGVRGRPIVRVLALPVVQPHTPARLYQRSLSRRVRSL